MQVGCSIFASQVQFFLREAACRADSPLYSTLAIPLLVLWPPSHHDTEDISAKRFVYTAVRQKIEPLSLKSFRQSPAREGLVADSHSDGTIPKRQKL
jgi:hypothetical protein